jgi:hypothetical protein
MVAIIESANLPCSEAADARRKVMNWGRTMPRSTYDGFDTVRNQLSLMQHGMLTDVAARINFARGGGCCHWAAGQRCSEGRRMRPQPCTWASDASGSNASDQRLGCHVRTTPDSGCVPAVQRIGVQGQMPSWRLFRARNRRTLTIGASNAIKLRSWKSRNPFSKTTDLYQCRASSGMFAERYVAKICLGPGFGELNRRQLSGSTLEASMQGTNAD